MLYGFVQATERGEGLVVTCCDGGYEEGEDSALRLILLCISDVDVEDCAVVLTDACNHSLVVIHGEERKGRTGYGSVGDSVRSEELE